MANSPQARKRVRQNVQKRLHNAQQRSKMRTFIKKVRHNVALQQLDMSQNALQVAQSVLDKAAKVGLIHKNTANRQKSRLNAQVKKLAIANISES